MYNLSFEDVFAAQNRIKNHIKNTPLVSSEKLNEEFGVQVFLKMENQQETKSFKARGAFNAILSYKEKHKKFPEKIVVQSSGNHAQGTAFACKKFGIPLLVYMIKAASQAKIDATRALGAEVVLLEKRSEVNAAAEAKQKEGYFFIHPADGNDVIAAQGTAALEALQEIGEVEAIFAPCGGGGLIGGSFLAAQGLSPKAKVFACEPANANDAARSFRDGKIFAFADTPKTIADGARTLAVSAQSFENLKKLSGVLEISEEEIIFWQKKISEILQQKIEPTSALAIAGLAQFVKKNKPSKDSKFLIIISGGNLSS